MSAANERAAEEQYATALISATYLDSDSPSIGYILAVYKSLGDFSSHVSAGSFIVAIEDVETKEHDYYYDTGNVASAIDAYRERVGSALSVSECLQAHMRAKQCLEGAQRERA